MFQVGDLVMCNTEWKYDITNVGVLCIVIALNEDEIQDIRVKVIDYYNPQVCLNDYNSSYWVESQFFNKVE